MPGDKTDVTVDRVDADGIHVSGSDDLVLDVSFDERRIWSFWLLRDTEPDDEHGTSRYTPWPPALRRFLDGGTRLTISTHVDSVVLHDEETWFATSQERIAIVNADGKPLGFDKSGRLQMTFDTRSDDEVAPLLDSIEEVLDALHASGINAFPAYGTLLGAVRDGALIGHDSDADIGYVSRETVPVDVIRESFRLQRSLADMGYRITRYSGAGFKVDVREADGSTRGLDVFGGFFDGEQLVLMGEIRTPFRKDWVFPLGTTTLEGRTLPAPANTDKFLAATYGESWRVPDPAFAFETPQSTHRRLNGWFRGTRVGRADWDRRYQGRRSRPPNRGPDPIVEFIRDHEPDLTSLIDIGCGRGHNTRWFARRGFPALGLDYSARAFEFLDESDRWEEFPLDFAELNLMEMRQVLAHGARLAHSPGPHTMLARHLADTLTAAGRDHLWRFCNLTGRSGGRLYLEFLTDADPEDPWMAHQLLTPLDPDLVVEELAAHGGRVASSEQIGPAEMGMRKRESKFKEARRARRMVVEWKR
ncbi:MAG: class I SAM-dependent methyltransferase [Nocardioides sp.]|nr:class I SAM-dependent methyltransferase [Nocardioides sp.]